MFYEFWFSFIKRRNKMMVGNLPRVKGLKEIMSCIFSQYVM